MSPRNENECRGCGEEIADDAEGFHTDAGYCTEVCFDKRPLGTGYSKSDHD